MFSNKSVSNLLQSHRVTSEVIRPVHQLEDLYSDSGAFAGDCRGLSLSFCTDGMNPFGMNPFVKEKATNAIQIWLGPKKPAIHISVFSWMSSRASFSLPRVLCYVL